MTVLQERGVYKKLGITVSTVSNLRRAMEREDSRIPSLDKMEEMLANFGATILQEKVWELPDIGDQ